MDFFVEMSVLYFRQVNKNWYNELYKLLSVIITTSAAWHIIWISLLPNLYPFLRLTPFIISFIYRFNSGVLAEKSVTSFSTNIFPDILLLHLTSIKLLVCMVFIKVIKQLGTLFLSEISSPVFNSNLSTLSLYLENRNMLVCYILKICLQRNISPKDLPISLFLTPLRDFST